MHHQLLLSLICFGFALAPAVAFHVGPRATLAGRTDLAASVSGYSGDNNGDFIPMSPEKRPPPQGGDMSYVRDNITRQMDNYLQIRKAGWPDDDCISDVYVRNPLSFLRFGSLARSPGVSRLASRKRWLDNGISSRNMPHACGPLN